MRFIRRLLHREPAFRVHKLDDNTLVFGDALFRGLTTPRAPPTQAALDAVVALATRVSARWSSTSGRTARSSGP